MPPRLRSRLSALAKKYDALGLDLFVFGSFARGDDRPNSDLDLGVEGRDLPSPALLRTLRREVEDLPTIRPIDLVDFSRVSPRWKLIAERDRRSLVEK